MEGPLRAGFKDFFMRRLILTLPPLLGARDVESTKFTEAYSTKRFRTIALSSNRVLGVLGASPQYQIHESLIIVKNIGVF